MNLNCHNMIGNDECDGLKNIKERKISSQAPKSLIEIENLDMVKVHRPERNLVGIKLMNPEMQSFLIKGI